MPFSHYIYNPRPVVATCLALPWTGSNLDEWQVWGSEVGFDVSVNQNGTLHLHNAAAQATVDLAVGKWCAADPNGLDITAVYNSPGDVPNAQWVDWP